MGARARHGRMMALAGLLLLAPSFAGCSAGPDDATLDGPGWEVGDRWTYRRTLTGGLESLYVREVVALVERDGHELFRVQEGIVGSPVVQYSHYTIDTLRFFGMEVREGGNVVQSTQPEEPVIFHYLFPLAHGTKVQDTGILHQASGGITQEDPIRVEATASGPRDLALDERVFRVFPYTITIHYEATPFFAAPVIRGHWDEKIGQSVLTTLVEGDITISYALLSFERHSPPQGGPSYRLASGLASRALGDGIRATLAGPGHARFLFHVEGPAITPVTFSLPVEEGAAGASRIDFASIRPLGYTRAGLANSLADVADDGVVLHVGAVDGSGAPVSLHAPADGGTDRVRFAPGQVYELLLASNSGAVSAKIGAGARIMRPIETGGVDVIAVNHRAVHMSTEPGPQNLRDAVTAVVSLPEGARVEGVFYARNHGADDEALGEVGAVRSVRATVNAVGLDDPVAVYGFYIGYAADATFTVESAFEYHADFALQGAVDYEVGALLLRLVDADEG